MSVILVFFHPNTATILQFQAIRDWPRTAAATSQSVVQCGERDIFQLVVEWWHFTQLNSSIELIDIE